MSTPDLVAPLSYCLQIVVACLLTQMNYLNKSLDLFNTAIVSPIYYVMFTLLTIIASVIMFQVCYCSVLAQAQVLPGEICCLSACLPVCCRLHATPCCMSSWAAAGCSPVVCSVA